MCISVYSLLKLIIITGVGISIVIKLLKSSLIGKYMYFCTISLHPIHVACMKFIIILSLLIGTYS